MGSYVRFKTQGLLLKINNDIDKMLKIIARHYNLPREISAFITKYN